MRFPVGKLPIEFLDRMLGRIPPRGERVLAGARIGEDAVVIDMGEKCLVLKTDPITFATSRIGWYAVNVNANDIACTGAKPLWFIASVLLPQNSSDEELVESIFNDILRACEEIGVELCGGHTEITYDLGRPIIVGCMLGEVDKRHLVLNRKVKPGDKIILTKGIAIEGTALIALEKRDEIPLELAQRASGFLDQPGISVVKEALVASRTAPLSAMHDPTEGGLATGLLELCAPAEAGVLVEESEVPVLPECQELCSMFALNPWGLIASGSLLIVAEPQHADRVLSAISTAGIKCAIIGEIREREFGLKVATSEAVRDLPRFQRDELVRLFE